MSISRKLGQAFLLVLLALALFAHSADAPHRIVAVGDVHGANDAFVAILQKAQLIDAQQQWIGGNATLVQTGDLLDRGPKGRAAMNLLMALEKQAPKTGGHVVALLGNHEVMNLIGDLRYVPPEEYANYADSDSPKRQDEAYRQYAEYQERKAQEQSPSTQSSTASSEEQWKKEHPSGYVEQREALGPEGKYGRWLRSKPAIAEIDGIIFLHGGIDPNSVNLKVKEINDRIKNEIESFDNYKGYFLQKKLILPFFTLDEITAAAKAELDRTTAGSAWMSHQKDARQHAAYLEDFLKLGGWLSIHPNGPLWFRGFSEWNDEQGTQNLQKLDQIYHAKHFVVAHTVQSSGRIESRFGGKIFLIDTGMNSTFFPGGRASALEIQNGKFTAIYTDGTVPLLSDETAIQ